MRRIVRLAALSAVSALAVCAGAAAAEIIVSANDGKQVRPGDVQTGPVKDTVSVLRLDKGAPKVIGTVDTPATMFGPPTSVAVAPDESFAVVTASQRLDVDGKLQPDGVVTVVGLKDPARPSVLQSLRVGPGAMTVSLNRKATLAMVTSTVEDSVAIFSVTKGRLAEVGKVQLEPKSEPRNVVITPDGKSAYVVRFGDGKITRLAIDGTRVSRAGEITVGVQPNSAVVTADGRYLFNTNFGGALSTTPKIGAVSIVDLKTGSMIGAVEVGLIPEHLALSPDGKYLAVVVGNGSATLRTAKNFDTVFGKLKLFRITRGALSPVAEVDTGHNCQGAIFSKSGRLILQQCAVERNIEAFKFDGRALARDPAQTLEFEARPGALASARSR